MVVAETGWVAAVLNLLIGAASVVVEGGGGVVGLVQYEAKTHAGRRGGRCAKTRSGLAKSCDDDMLPLVTSIASGSYGG